jgi:hypothetical protein
VIILKAQLEPARALQNFLGTEKVIPQTNYLILLNNYFRVKQAQITGIGFFKQKF